MTTNMQLQEVNHKNGLPAMHLLIRQPGSEFDFGDKNLHTHTS